MTQVRLIKVELIVAHQGVTYRRVGTISTDDQVRCRLESFICPIIDEGGCCGIGIDTGAAYGGPLTAIRLPDETIFQV